MVACFGPILHSGKFHQYLLLACRSAWPTLSVCFIVGGFSADSSTAAKIPNKTCKRKEGEVSKICLILSARKVLVDECCSFKSQRLGLNFWGPVNSFLSVPPQKKLKYGKPWLGESTLT